MTEPTNPTDPTNPAKPATPADAQPDETFGWTTEDAAHASTDAGAAGSASSGGRPARVQIPSHAVYLLAPAGR